MEFKKRENENRLSSKYFELGNNPNKKNKKCKFLINVVGGWGGFPEIILENSPNP